MEPPYRQPGGRSIPWSIQLLVGVLLLLLSVSARGAPSEPYSPRFLSLKAKDASLLLPAPEGFSELLEMEALLDQLAQEEAERVRSREEAWRGAFWMACSLGMGALGLALARPDQVEDLPLAMSWGLCSLAGSYIGIHLVWRGLAREWAAEAELRRIDLALRGLSPHPANLDAAPQPCR